MAVYVYVLVYPAFGDGALDENDQVASVAAFASGWGARAFFFVATVLFGWWVARRVREGIIFHGVLVGLIGAAVNQAIVWFFVPPVTLSELYVYLVFGVAGGALGGVLGRTSLTGEVYRASRQVGEARDPAAVAAALGENLAGPDVHGVTLWQRVTRDAAGPESAAGERTQDLVLWGSWVRGGRPWNPGERLDGRSLSALRRLEDGSSAAIIPADLPASHRAAWEREGIHSALLVPLVAPGESWLGLAMVTFCRRRRFSRNELRAYLTISAQAALVLENLRLVDEARHAGRRTGILVERQRMAHEIHDTLAQGFASVIVSLAAAEMSRGSSNSHADWSRHLEEARRTARESLTEARRLVWALQPETLDRRSLSEALDLLAREWSQDTGIEAHAATSGKACPLRPETEVALLRTAQEGLANVRKHARAQSVTITLSYIGDRVVLDLLDDGVGFDTSRLKRVVGAHDTGGFGLRAMRERIEQLGGTLIVESAPGEGTTIVVELLVAPDGPEIDGAEAGTTEEVRDA
jgi:signal transduction histidine kinase